MVKVQLVNQKVLWQKKCKKKNKLIFRKKYLFYNYNDRN